MSKYDKLWKYVSEQQESNFTLSYEQIESIAGLPIDHSFLTYKKELLEYGYKVGKISMKNKTVEFSIIAKESTDASLGFLENNFISSRTI